MATYVFTNSGGTMVLRNDADHVPWSTDSPSHPLDVGGSAYRQWVADGSPQPSAYVAPPPTADETRIAALLADTDRQNFVSAAIGATPQQIKNYITNNVTDLATARQMLIRLALLVILEIRR